MPSIENAGAEGAGDEGANADVNGDGDGDGGSLVLSTYTMDDRQHRQQSTKGLEKGSKLHQIIIIYILYTTCN